MRDPLFGVREEKVQALRKKMEELGLSEADIEEKFIRSQGHGGQKVNKTSTCVQLRHIPTGITVKCQESRSQPLNRFLARRLLIEKLEAHLLGKESPSEKIRQKIRKQKARRRRRRRKASDV